jgi:Holliday junction resolvasome RuvABC endonuclease subunit
MKTIGFKCWGDKISYVVLSGTQESPEVIMADHIKAPKNAIRPEQLNWLRNEIHEILNTYSPDVGYFKAIEGNSRNKDLARVEFEGVLQEAGYSHKSKLEINGILKRHIVQKTPADKARYLGELFDDDNLRHLSGANYQDACLSALIGIPNGQN